MLKCVLKNHKQEQKKKKIKSNEQRVLNIIIRPLILDGWHQCSLAKSLHQGVRQNTKNLTNKQTKKETLVQKVRKNMQSQLRAQGERIVVPHADIGRTGQRKRTKLMFKLPGLQPTMRECKQTDKCRGRQQAAHQQAADVKQKSFMIVFLSAYIVPKPDGSERHQKHIFSSQTFQLGLNNIFCLISQAFDRQSLLQKRFLSWKRTSTFS